ncbi:MAG: cobalamin-dependent protein, partial [Candidatus Latescibacterota bacterium]
MKILLINPNRYRTPPVPPLGLEYLSDALKKTRHTCRILDLCFEENAIEAIESAVRDFNPDTAGLTIRNIDTVLFENNIFF